MVAISQAPSPESNPNSPLPVISLVSPYLTIHLIGQSFVWFIAAPSRPRALLRFATIFPLPPHCCEGKKNILLFVFVPCCVVQKVRTSSSHKASLLHSWIGFSLFWLPRLWVHFSYFPLMPRRAQDSRADKCYLHKEKDRRLPHNLLPHSDISYSCISSTINRVILLLSSPN